MSNFKAGDWVEYGNNLLRVKQVDNSRSEKYIQVYTDHPSNEWYNAEDFTLWQPQPDEWCWFNHGYHINPTLIKYANQCIDKCEPFVGTLPSFLQN